MHELSLAANIFEIVRCSVDRPQDVETINVTVGNLSGVNIEALQFGFEALAQQFGFSGVKLVVHSKRAKILCEDCNCSYECDSLDELCPKCGSIERKIIGGTEFTIDSCELKG